MMIRYFCDLCGCEVNDASELTHMQDVYSTETDYASGFPIRHEEPVDVCDDCLNRIKKARVDATFATYDEIRKENITRA